MFRRLIDGAVLGVAGGCAAAVIVAGAIWWLGRPQPELGWDIAILGGASGLGAALGARRRMPLAEIALRADRALGTDELFSSALFARSVADADAKRGDLWGAAVIFEAQRRAAELAPRSFLQTVLGPGMGARARVAVLLLAGAVVTAAASLPAGRDPSSGAAVSEASAVVAPSASDTADAAGGAVLRIGVAMPPAPQGVAPADDLASRMDGTLQNDSSSASGASVGGTTSTIATADWGHGAGESRTTDASDALPQSAGAAGRTTVDPGGRVAGGERLGVDAAMGPSMPGPFSSGTAGPASVIVAPAISGQEVGGSSIRLIENPFATGGDGEAPDADRDLLRDYFSPIAPSLPKGSP